MPNLIFYMMTLCLKTAAKAGNIETYTLCLSSRLPSHIQSPCQLISEIQVKKVATHYNVDVKVFGTLNITCLRCLQLFSHDYQTMFTLAVFGKEAEVEPLKTEECIVLSDGMMNLSDILIDELYLSSPEKHPNPSDCEELMRTFLLEGTSIKKS